MGGPARKRARMRRGAADKSVRATVHWRAMKGLKGKYVLVTGATTGIGNATAIRFAEEGCNVSINYRSNPEAAKETLAAAQKASADSGHAGAKHVIVYGDVSKEEDVKKMFAETL